MTARRSWTTRAGLTAATLVMAATTAGCAGALGESDGDSGGLSEADSAAAADERAAYDSPAGEQTTSGGFDGTGSATDLGEAAKPSALSVDVVDRSVIRTGSMRVRAEDVVSTALQAAAAARTLGGLVAGEQTVNDPDDPGRTVADLTLRVPGARFDDLIDDIRGLGVVLEQTQSAEDVTVQVADVDARVDAQRASVRRIQALLARAETIGQVVTVEAQLAQRQAELEALLAQQKALADQTALATLRVTVVGPDPVGTAEDPTGFVAGLDRGWDAFTSAMTAGLTALGAVTPFVGFALLVGVPFALWARTRTRRTAAVAPPPADPVKEEVPVGR